MAALRVPTTRCLCVVATGDGVVRQWYGEDGRERVLNEPGAVGTRVARSYLRFGQMELFTQRGDLPLLQALYLLWPYLLWVTCRCCRHTPSHALAPPPPSAPPRRPSHLGCRRHRSWPSTPNPNPNPKPNPNPNLDRRRRSWPSMRSRGSSATCCCSIPTSHAHAPTCACSRRHASGRHCSWLSGCVSATARHGIFSYE